MSKTIIVVPCYNEELRLNLNAFREAPDFLHWLFVNDGSTDKTLKILEQLQQESPERFNVLSLPHNVGKAEAVRLGMLKAFEQNPDQLAYFDSDLATPIEELIRVLEQFEVFAPKACMGSRIRLLGAHIERRTLRHYIGRIFATFASLILNLRVYDTQCGAKVFVPNRELQIALSAPFSSSWLFDIELIGRLLNLGYTEHDFLEVPLRYWNDIAGSKIDMTDGLVAFIDLARIFFHIRIRKTGQLLELKSKALLPH